MLRIVTLIAAVCTTATVLADTVSAQDDGVIRKRLRNAPGDLRLPRAPQSGADDGRDRAEQEPARRDGRTQAFEQAVHELRRTAFLAASKEEQLLYRLGEHFDRIPERTLELARRADSDLLHGCMRVLHLYGMADAPRCGEQIKFLLLTRPLRGATEVAVDTMAHLLQDEADDALFDLLTAEKAIVRHCAGERLAERMRAVPEGEHARRLLVLARQGSRDVQLQVTRLLGHAPRGDERVARYLIDALARDPGLAAAAVDALVERGDDAVAALRTILERPAVDRSFGYAALALAQIEERRFAERAKAEPLFTPAMKANLVEELTAPDRFTQSAVALGLAELAWRSDSVDGSDHHDREVVGALVQVVAPTAFVPHLAMLQPVAQQRLSRLSGRGFGLDYGRWRNWWETVENVDGWVAARADVDVEEADAPLTHVTVPWRAAAGDALGADLGEVLAWRFRGDRVDWLTPEPNVLDIVLDPTEMVLLVDELRRHGFPRDVARVPEDDPTAVLGQRGVELDVRGARCATPARTHPDVLARFAKAAHAFARDQRWQLYRDRARSPDLLAWWRSERRWRSEHADEPERLVERSADRLVARFAAGDLEGPRLRLALLHLQDFDDLPSLLTVERGLSLVAAAGALERWDGRSADLLLSIIVRSPHDEVWQGLLEKAQQRIETEGADVVSQLFRMLGADRLLAAFDHPSRVIRLLAMQEAADLGDRRAVPLLIDVLETEQDTALRRTAATCLGLLRAPAAEAALAALAHDPDVDASVRRATWIALGRIGAPSALEVLARAQLSTDPADRRAVIEAAGELQQPAAVDMLAQIYGIRGEDELGLLAKSWLRRAGDLLATPALHRLLQHRDDTMRRNVALLLAEFQDRAALEQLIQMLSGPASYRAARLIATITGVDVIGDNDRQGAMRRWLSTNAQRTQGEWLVEALANYEVETTLTPTGLGPGASEPTLRELCRLMVEAEPAHLRCLAGRLLRQSTGYDFGTVSLQTEEVARRAIADRYLFLLEAPDSAADARNLPRSR